MRLRRHLRHAIGTETRDCLPHLYGAVNWALVEDVKKPPLKSRALPAADGLKFFLI
jgi:hypothetical protein